MTSPALVGLFLDAQCMLDQAASRCSYRESRFRELAADALAALPDDLEIARLASAVIGGGVFMPRRALELAAYVVKLAAEP